MARISSNAGKHPYLRPDYYKQLFETVIPKEKGIPFDPNEQPKFMVEVDTEYKDSNGDAIYFKNIVNYMNKLFVIDYDGKQFCWIIRNLNDPSKTYILKNVAKKIEIKNNMATTLV